MALEWLLNSILKNLSKRSLFANPVTYTSVLQSKRAVTNIISSLLLSGKKFLRKNTFLDFAIVDNTEPYKGNPEFA